MTMKIIVLGVLLAVLGINVIRNLRWGFRTAMKGYYVRALINFSILTEIVLLWLGLKLLFYLVLAATIIFIVLTASHVHELRKNEADKKKQ